MYYLQEQIKLAHCLSYANSHCQNLGIQIQDWIKHITAANMNLSTGQEHLCLTLIKLSLLILILGGLHRRRFCLKYKFEAEPQIWKNKTNELGIVVLTPVSSICMCHWDISMNQDLLTLSFINQSSRCYIYTDALIL